MSILLHRLKTNFSRLAFRLGRRLRQNFFLYLAAVFTVLAVVDTATVNYVGGMRQSSYDLMLRLRLNVPAPAHDIVIIDIDEKTLAAMAPEYGRWPWPRQVLAEFVERLAGQEPQAIVFDVLFSDADIQNPDSDAYFNEVLANTPNTFLPMLRLDPTHDKQSALRFMQVPGAEKLNSNADDNTTVAMVIPPFAGAQQAGRLGTNNIYPDIDGVVRRYPVRLQHANWTLPALPLIVAQAASAHNAPQTHANNYLTAPDSILINWRGKPFTYPYASFSDIYFDLLKENPTRPSNEFAGKILIIGSTAAGLHDIKGTPLDRQFPGVEILATAIDNVRSGDWIRAPDVRWFYLAITLAIIWGTALAFFRSGAGTKVDKIYGLSAFVLLGFSYATVNLGNLYINLSGPVFLGALYFSIARIYAFATERALDNSLVARQQTQDGRLQGVLLTVQFTVETREEAALEKLAAWLRKQTKNDMSVEILQGRQKGLWRLFENTLVICWACPTEDDATAQAIHSERDGILKNLADIVQAAGVAAALPAKNVVIKRSEGRIRANQPEDWRILFAATLLHEDRSNPGDTT